MGSCRFVELLPWKQDHVAFALVVSFRVIMADKFRYCTTESFLPEQHQLGKALSLYRQNPALRKSVQIRSTWWKPDQFGACFLDDLAKAFSELRIPVHDQVTATGEKAIIRACQIPGDLLNPGLIWITGDPGDLDLPAADLAVRSSPIGLVPRR